jgi:hypothetical protein
MAVAQAAPDANANSGSHSESAMKHLSPAVGQALQDAATDALQPVLRSGFTVTRVDVRDDEIELEIQDQRSSPYGITLALRGSKRSAAPDGQGRNFLFYFTPSPAPANPDAATALLAAAARFDQAIPDTALQAN